MPGFAADATTPASTGWVPCVSRSASADSVSACHSIAGAYAEKSLRCGDQWRPPASTNRRSDPLLHHRVRDFNTQREVFEKITVASASLDDPLTAFREIDRCLAACARYSRPVYLELPRDRVRTKSLHPPRSEP